VHSWRSVSRNGRKNNEPVSSPTSLTFDTDWMSFVGGVIGVGFSLLLAISTWARVIHGTPAKTGLSWYSGILVIYCLLFVISEAPRTLRYGAAVVGVIATCRIVLYLAKAPISTQTANAQLARIVEAFIWTAFFVNSCLWFRTILVRLERQD
jgi:hypothetical protein